MRQAHRRVSSGCACGPPGVKRRYDDPLRMPLVTKRSEGIAAEVNTSKRFEARVEIHWIYTHLVMTTPKLTCRAPPRIRTYLPTRLPAPGICSYQRGHAKGAAATACHDIWYGMNGFCVSV